MTNKEQALETIRELVNRFEEQLPTLKNSKYKEHNLRTEYLNPFWEALGWDVSNKQGKVQAYKEVEQEDTLKIENLRGAPDYCFRKNKDKRFFYLEAKKPIENIKDNIDHAQQTRTYGWCGNLNISILSDFEEFSLYDCTKKPKQTDSVRTARLEYMTYKEYEQNFDFLWDTFSRESVFNGSIDQFASKNIKRGKDTVDKEFLISLDNWRTELAENISLRNKNHIDEDQLNFAVQHIIDRLIFLRIAEDRNIEPYGNLKNQTGENFYQNIQVVFAQANDRYNSGLFDPNKDQITATLTIDNKVIKDIVTDMYYPKSPYLFDVISVEILGSAYEQFLGKTITINNRGKAIIELKPEVRKAGGVYYTPQYIVDYIVENTVGKLLENKSPKEASEIKICDPACGSGSFLLGAYQYLLNWHKDYYLANPSKKNPLTDDANLTTAEKKRILLNNIFGVDIDTNAVEVTKLSLLLKCMEGETQASISHQMTMFHERVLPTLDDNIKSGNSLIDTDFYDGMIEFEERKIKPFNWQKAFPNVFQKGGFDVVIGNPPYVMMQNIDSRDSFDYILKTFSSAKYKIDTYQIFIEAGIHLLNKDGMLGYITPNTFIKNIHSLPLRQFILDKTHIREILFFDYSVFSDASVDTLVLILSKVNSNQLTQIYKVYEAFLPKEIVKIDQKLFYKNKQLDFNFNLTSNDIEIIEKIKSKSVSLGNYCNAYFGIQTYDRKKYVSKNKENKYYEVVIDGSNILPYYLKPNIEYVDTRPEAIKSGGDSKVYKQDKICIRQIGNFPIATFVPANIYGLNTLYSVFPNQNSAHNLKYYLGIINSNVNKYYWKKLNSDEKKTFPKIKKEAILSIRIPICDNSKSDSIKVLVDQLLILNKDLQAETLESKREQIKRKIDHFEDKINELVYKLYDLTEEEIRIIENG